MNVTFKYICQFIITNFMHASSLPRPFQHGCLWHAFWLNYFINICLAWGRHGCMPPIYHANASSQHCNECTQGSHRKHLMWISHTSFVRKYLSKSLHWTRINITYTVCALSFSCMYPEKVSVLKYITDACNDHMCAILGINLQGIILGMIPIL